MNKIPDSGYHKCMLLGMKVLLAVLIAISVAWFWDRLLYHLGLNEQLRIRYGVPIGEEIIKYITSSFFHISIILVYGLFGFGEGLLEITQNSKHIESGLNRMYFIFTGCLTHLLFSLFFLTTIPVYLQLTLAICAHIFWNFWVLHRLRY